MSGGGSLPYGGSGISSNRGKIEDVFIGTTYASGLRLMQKFYRKESGMTGNARLPMGIEDFEEMRTQGYYYVDKTGLIRDLLDHLGKVNLLTRPRRFGKTLNISMEA